MKSMKWETRNQLGVALSTVIVVPVPTGKKKACIQKNNEKQKFNLLKSEDFYLLATKVPSKPTLRVFSNFFSVIILKPLMAHTVALLQYPR